MPRKVCVALDATCRQIAIGGPENAAYANQHTITSESGIRAADYELEATVVWKEIGLLIKSIEVIAPWQSKTDGLICDQ